MEQNNSFLNEQLKKGKNQINASVDGLLTSMDNLISQLEKMKKEESGAKLKDLKDELKKGADTLINIPTDGN